MLNFNYAINEVRTKLITINPFKTTVNILANEDKDLMMRVS